MSEITADEFPHDGRGRVVDESGVSGASPSAEKLYLENTLLRVAGALFRHDAKRAASTVEQIVVRGGLAEKTITIRPDARVGQPGPLAHKLFIALLKKHSDYGLPVRGQVSFTKREIMAMIGRKSWGGRDSEELTRALHEIHYSFVTAHFRDNTSGKWIEHSFNVFPEIWIERREFASDPIEACTVTLAAPIIASLKDEHFTCLNHTLMSGLGTIGQALYLRLFFHFANLYDGRNGKALSFPKRYDAICSEWLGGLTILAHASKITGEQLGSHIDRLIAAKFLSRYTLTKARNGDGFVVTFYPGAAFFEDFNRFYGKGQKPILSTTAGAAEQHDGEALKVAYLFAQKRTGQPIAYVSSKDKETAKQFLEQLAFEEIPAFLDFALEEAARTNFDVQTLGGIKPYLATYLATRARRSAAAARQAAHRQQEQAEAEQQAAEARRLAAARQRFDTLSDADQTAIRDEAEAKARKFPMGSLREAMLEHHIARLTAERFAPDDSIQLAA
ncbi:MAG: replication initiator protein A [Devosia sp.]|nr:replication initiator protein A [Devosia sp.]